MSEPFAIRNLGVLNYSIGFTLWVYKAPHINDVMADNYFGDAVNMVAAGDHMHVCAPDGNALLAVIAATDGAVRAQKIAWCEQAQPKEET